MVHLNLEKFKFTSGILSTPKLAVETTLRACSSRDSVPVGARSQQCSPVLTSVTSSAELWQPWTMLLVHWERSLLISALKRCVSIPCLVPVRVAKDRSTPGWGSPFPGPEWTNLFREREKEVIKVETTLFTGHVAWEKPLNRRLVLSLLLWNQRVQCPLVFASQLPSPRPVSSQWWSDIKERPRTVHLVECAEQSNNMTWTIVRQVQLYSLIQKERERTKRKRERCK